MIVSHRHRFIFFAVPRTATHSIRDALRPHLGPNDWEQQMLTRHRHLPIPELAAVRHGHISVSQAEAHLPAEIWRSYFKFAFVRHPVDRFVSACCFLNRGNPEFAGRETAWMKQALTRPPFLRRVLIAPQVSLLHDRTGRIPLDLLGRYEGLQAAFEAVCERVGLPGATLAAANASRRETPAHYLEPDLEDALTRFYAADFTSFGYPPRP
ncbi:MAG: sulfotransferase family 2 domain-containing protein [Pseudomonadota bacterium]